MRKRTWPLLLTLCLVAAGCRGGAATNAPASKGGGIDALVSEFNAFTDELVKKVESAADTSAGVDEAQALVDGRRDELREKFRAAKQSREFREDKAANGRLLECEVSNSDRVAALSTRYLDQSMKDPALRSKLGNLRTTYSSIFD